MITLADGKQLAVYRCSLEPHFDWLFIECIRASRAEVEAAFADPAARERIVYENGEYRMTYEGYTVLQGVDDTDIGVEVRLIRPQESEENRVG